MRVTATLADKVSKMAPDEIVHIIIKLRLFEEDLLSEVVQQPRVTIRQVIKMLNAISLAVPAGRIEYLSREPWIEKIEEDAKVYAVLDDSVPAIGVPAAWDMGFTGKGVKIAIIDTGIDRRHSDFSDRVIAVRNFTLEEFKDSNGHGSLVAGIAAGSGNSSDKRYRGIAPDASMLSGKVLKADGSGRVSDVMAAVEWAAGIGADIINLSLSTETPSDASDALCELCDMVVEAGVIVCAAAGNDGPGRSTVGSPAAARRVLTVGAVTENNLVAEFSSRGPTAGDRLKPEVVAPGMDIVSVRAKNTRAGKPVDDYYTSATGTSLAAAHVSGLIALLLEANRKASPQLVREALMHSAIDLGLDEYTQGAGMVQAEAALRYIQTHENPPDPIDQSPTKSAFLALMADTYGNLTQRSRRKR